MAWLASRYDAAALERLERLTALVREEAGVQNLVAPSTLSLMWSRHIVDSIQLDKLVAANDGPWVDVGTGAGFPGLAIACVRPCEMFLVEPRRRRAEFLHRAVVELRLSNVKVLAAKVEAVRPLAASVISARAVASMVKLFDITTHIRTGATTYVLPRGSAGLEEVEELQERINAMFHVEHSVTDPASIIVVATGVGAACTV